MGRNNSELYSISTNNEEPITDQYSRNINTYGTISDNWSFSQATCRSNEPVTKRPVYTNSNERQSSVAISRENVDTDVDGGWAWAVFIGAFMSHVLAGGEFPLSTLFKIHEITGFNMLTLI